MKDEIDRSEEIKDILNQEDDRIECICPKCKQSFVIFPEHLGRALCQECEVELVDKSAK
jgi:hypothetical protein